MNMTRGWVSEDPESVETMVSETDYRKTNCFWPGASQGEGLSCK